MPYKMTVVPRIRSKFLIFLLTPKLEDHPLSAGQNFLFSIFVVVIHISDVHADFCSDKSTLEDLDIDGRSILRMVLNK